MRRFLLFSLVFIGLAACQSADESIVTPPVAPTVSTLISPPPISSTKEPPDTPTAVSTSNPSAAPAAQPTNAPTATDTPLPTNTPIPETAVTHISLAPIAGGFVKPVYLTHAGDERLFVVEQDGTIRIIQDGAVLPQPFLDIDSPVGSQSSEQGLLSMAFHPNYGGNGRFFVYYTDNNGDTVIARYQVSANDPNQADPDSALALFTLPQPFANHNGGQLAFGPDGYLYAGLGDGGNQNDPQGNGQNLSTLLGAILRLDIDFDDAGYAIPADNPFVNDNDKRNEIWAYGLRNPWRFSFDRLTNDLYIADVGQNLWEEIDWLPAGAPGGANFGWNVVEGTHCLDSETCPPTGLPPIHEYPHGGGSCSVTGGYVYRGQQFLALYGNYFFADYCSGIFWSLFPEADGSWTATQLLDSPHFVSSFGEDVDGELYFLSYGEGTVYQIRP